MEEDMSVGSQVTKNDVDNRAAQLALALRATFDGLRHFKIWLDAQTDPMLTELGYTSGDIAVLRSAAGDLDELRRVYEGTLAVAVPRDFRAFAKFLTGVS